MPSLLVISALAVLAPLAARGIGRVLRVPIIVFELILGILVGPSLLGWVQPWAFIEALSDFGLALLFFVAGTEIQASALRGRTGRRAWIGWLISIVAGIAIGLILLSGEAAVIVGIALASTALGTLIPILRDAGELRTPFGQSVSAVGTVGEFGPLVAISVFLGGRNPGLATLVLLLFAVIAGLAVWWAMKVPQGRLHAFVDATLHTSGQFAVRLVLLILAALAVLSIALEIDMLLGAFTAGILWKLLMREADERTREAVDSKIEAVAFGFLVPIFFIYTGVTFDLEALIAEPVLLLFVPVTLVVLLVVRGLPSMLAAPAGASGRERVAVMLMGATALPIIVAVTAIGVSEEIIPSSHAAVLVGAGMLSVLLFPLLATAVRGTGLKRDRSRPIEDDAA
ncbi:cation:proton antiporter [Microbacterium awajiense]|uniref:Cation:proton antiporter n=2 Tax=Microbacterium awajiense TaxID=415214 RepID=A0ABP7AJX0_9MICO